MCHAIIYCMTFWRYPPFAQMCANLKINFTQMLLKKDRSERIMFVGFTLFVLAIYICFGMASYTAKSGPLMFSTRFLTEPVISDYYNNLAKSFTEGRLDVTDTRGKLDIIEFKGKQYLLWPPVPAIVLMPVVAIFGVDLPDRLINVLIGCINVFLFLLILKKLRQRYNFTFLNTPTIIALGTFWGLGTVHFWMSLSGTVWLISQIMAQTFLLAAVYRLLNSDKKITKYLVSGFWFALAVYTRNDLVFSGLFMALLIYEDFQGKILNKLFLKHLAIFSIFFVILSLLNLEYNYLRFGNPFDNGANYHLMGDIFKEKFEKWGYLSTHYIPHNLYFEVFKMPELSTSPPFIITDFEGFGLLWVSPLFLLLFPSLYFLQRKLKQTESLSGLLSNGTLMSVAALITIIPIAFTIFTVMGTGEFQFGARYTLDFHIFLCLLLLPVLEVFSKYKWFKFLCLILIGISCCINAIGIFLYY